MALSDLEKQEKLCHIRACLFMAGEHLAGRKVFPVESMLSSLEDGMDDVNLLMLEIKNETF